MIGTIGAPTGARSVSSFTGRVRAMQSPDRFVEIRRIGHYLSIPNHNGPACVTGHLLIMSYKDDGNAVVDIQLDKQFHHLATRT